MEYVIHSFRHAEIILNNEPKYKPIWEELLTIIDDITDEDIIHYHEKIDRKAKSLSQALNTILKERFISLGWNDESAIFQDEEYNNQKEWKNRWRLDFAKESISVEVAFNHGEAIAWNLLKPVLAGELNHVKKEINTDIGVIICATKGLKDKGGFDNAVGEYEKFLRYLTPLRDVLSVPIVIIGLKAPETFEIEVKKVDDKNQGFIVRHL